MRKIKNWYFVTYRSRTCRNRGAPTAPCRARASWHTTRETSRRRSTSKFLRCRTSWYCRRWPSGGCHPGQCWSASVPCRQQRSKLREKRRNWVLVFWHLQQRRNRIYCFLCASIYLRQLISLGRRVCFISKAAKVLWHYTLQVYIVLSPHVGKKNGRNRLIFHSTSRSATFIWFVCIYGSSACFCSLLVGCMRWHKLKVALWIFSWWVH